MKAVPFLCFRSHWFHDNFSLQKIEGSDSINPKQSGPKKSACIRASSGITIKQRKCGMQLLKKKKAKRRKCTRRTSPVLQTKLVCLPRGMPGNERTSMRGLPIVDPFPLHCLAIICNGKTSILVDVGFFFCHWFSARKFAKYQENINFCRSL